VENIEFGPLEVNYFSICFWINATIDTVQKGVYVKIPKFILYNKGYEQIMPLTNYDRQLNSHSFFYIHQEKVD